MRYSARTRNIVWRDDAITREAVACINDFLASDSPYIFRYRLEANEGIVSNNVLHNRSAFNDTEGSQRQLYRIRFFRRFNLDINN